MHSQTIINMHTADTLPTVWLIYDGECPICNASANALQIKATVGKLELINARTSHPLVTEVKQAGFDLDKGMVVKFNHTYYYGADAQHFLAMVGTTHDWVNRLNYLIFRHRWLATILYPVLKFFRGVFLSYKGIPTIHMANARSQPIFATIFGEQWQTLPEVFHKHYANRPYSHDIYIAEGKMNITCSGIYKLMAPVMKLLRLLPTQQATDIPVIVAYCSYPNSTVFELDRRFHYPNQKPYVFKTHMLPIKDDDVVELVLGGFGWRMRYVYDGSKVMLIHRGYVLKLFNLYIPLPLRFLFGKIHAEETALTNDTFSMSMTITHPLFGSYAYNGTFKMLSAT